MPTVVLLDVSLSMLRRLQVVDEQEGLLQRRHLAIQGLYAFFDHLSSKFKLEFTALVAFSSLWEIAVPFTRDYELLKQGCMSVDVYDKTCFENALTGVAAHVVEEWGTSVPVQIILVTDGSLGSGVGSLKELLDHRSENANRPLPFPFPSKLHVVCVANPAEMTGNFLLFQQLCDMNGLGGSVYVPEAPISVHSVQNCFLRLAQTHYISYEGVLNCGHLSSKITLSPPPDFSVSWNTVLQSYRKDRKENKIRRFPNEINICGFLDTVDVSSPASISRHLVIPIGKDGEGAPEDDGKAPSFCVLLHGSLKVEKMVAIVQIDSDWFGFLHSWADSKKKSNLVLATFAPGAHISWLGDFKQLGPSSELNPCPYRESEDGEKEERPFPCAPSQRRSYNSQANVAWIKPSGLQSDVQKVLRYAKRLPDKQGQFFKELNRIRRAALFFCFLELLDSLAMMLEKESGKVKPEAAIQLQHAASCLRSAPYHQLDNSITPTLE
ncbi:predicted protein [Nematostella vectensis]|uniref:Integrator complex subunit 14 n=1 Tax=Nematostella vectensis TaxID=45351 RepID=A7RS47_NEMVE|nr:predicted protein [Nematostella vectensis]|eukprot:XP_001637747.1 predicted protein [Nematostella vectensis]